MKLLLIHFGIIVLVAACCYPSGDNAEKILFALPQWGKLGSPNDSSRKLNELETGVKALCTRPPAEVRSALVNYLKKCNRNSMEASYLVDNARIVIAVYFKVLPSHPYAEYFEPKEYGKYRIRKPFFEADLNRGRNDAATDIDQVIKEFDKLMVFK